MKQQTEYTFHSSLDLNIQEFLCENLIIRKIILKKDCFNEVNALLL